MLRTNQHSPELRAIALAGERTSSSGCDAPMRAEIRDPFSNPSSTVVASVVKVM